MTSNVCKHSEMQSCGLNVDRRSFVKGALAAAAAAFVPASFGAERDWTGQNPVRYPDPDIVVLDKRFEKYKLGNTPIQRLHTGTLWAEGPAWNGVGRYLLWSDIPNDVQTALARRRRPRQRLPQSGRQQQRQHLRLRGPPDRLRARQPPRRPLRARRQRHRAGRQVERQAAQRAQRRGRASRTAASGSPIPATAA